MWHPKFFPHGKFKEKLNEDGDDEKEKNTKKSHRRTKSSPSPQTPLQDLHRSSKHMERVESALPLPATDTMDRNEKERYDMNDDDLHPGFQEPKGPHLRDLETLKTRSPPRSAEKQFTMPEQQHTSRNPVPATPHESLAKFKSRQAADYEHRYRSLSDIRPPSAWSVISSNDSSLLTQEREQHLKHWYQSQREFVTSHQYCQNLCYLNSKLNFSARNDLDNFLHVVSGAPIFPPEILAKRAHNESRERGTYCPVDLRGPHMRKQSLAQAEGKLGIKPLNERPKRRLELSPYRLPKTAGVEVVPNGNESTEILKTEEAKEQQPWVNDRDTTKSLQNAHLQPKYECPSKKEPRQVDVPDWESISEIDQKQEELDRIYYYQSQSPDERWGSDSDDDSDSEDGDGEYTINWVEGTEKGMKDTVRGMKMNGSLGKNVNYLMAEGKTSIAESFPGRYFF